MQPYYQQGALTIYQADNLAVLGQLQEQGARFDLCELDGPYGAGLEDWDTLTEAEYTEHYAARLSLVRQVLQPWGVAFVFGYPEMCAEIKAWAHQTETLHLRRWVTWYVQQTAHAGRRVQAILAFQRQKPDRLQLINFGRRTQEIRRSMGLSCEAVGIALEGSKTGRVGQGLHERPTGKYPPTPEIFYSLCQFHSLNPDEWLEIVDYNFAGLTDLDYITVPVERAVGLNEEGLRSKPLGLYGRLFRAVKPTTTDSSALILYGGSGNAAIAAGQLGYTVTVVEQDAARCELIAQRWAWHVERRAPDVERSRLGPLFDMEAA